MRRCAAGSPTKARGSCAATRGTIRSTMSSGSCRLCLHRAEQRARAERKRTDPVTRMTLRPRWFSLLAGFASAAVVSGWISRSRHEPATIAQAPVVSFTTIHGYHPLANAPPYIAGLLLALVVPIGLSRLFPRQPVASPAASPFRGPGRPSLSLALALLGSVFPSSTISSSSRSIAVGRCSAL